MNTNNQFEIYAELSRKQYKSIQSGEYCIEIPKGIRMENRKGSRGLHFYSNDKLLTKILINGLKNSGINYQTTCGSEKL